MALEIIARVDGKSVKIELKDLICIRTSDDDKNVVRILPTTVARCLALGAQLMKAEQINRKVQQLSEASPV